MKYFYLNNFLVLCLNCMIFSQFCTDNIMLDFPVKNFYQSADRVEYWVVPVLQTAFSWSSCETGCVDCGSRGVCCQLSARPSAQCAHRVSAYRTEYRVGTRYREQTDWWSAVTFTLGCIDAQVIVKFPRKNDF